MAARLTARQQRALDAGRVLAPPRAIDLRASRSVPVGGYTVDRADEDLEDPVGALLGLFEPATALELMSYASYVLRLWDGEPAVDAGLARSSGSGVFVLPVPPGAPPVMEIIYVRDLDRVVMLGGYLANWDKTQIDAAVREALGRRPPWIHW